MVIDGECVFWELCGREDYLVSYHQALMVHQPMQVHLITISLRQPLTVRLQQARFWLQFIMDRIPPENIGKVLMIQNLKNYPTIIYYIIY
jgi:hypothetical protein